MKNSAADSSIGGSETATSSNSPSLLPASVVVATRSRPELLDGCLGGVARQDIRPLEVLVVDNSYGEQATREVALAHGARYIVEPAQGVAIARNRGAQATSGEVVAYLDDDAVPEPEWLSALLVEFSDPLVVAVTGPILALEPQPPAAVERVIFGGPARLAVDRHTADWFERANFGGVGQGANLAIRRSVFETWPGFDQRLGQGTRMSGMEEHHAFFSLIDRGFRVLYTPAARVRHPYPQTEGELRTRHLRQLTAASFHLSLLLAEEPRYRRRAARYALEAIGGKPRPWRKGMGHPSPPVQRWQGALARLRGVVLYFGSRLESKRSRGRADAND